MKFDYFGMRGKVKWEGDEIWLFWHERESEMRGIWNLIILA